jgi:HEAT repeat protein
MMFVLFVAVMMNGCENQTSAPAAPSAAPLSLSRSLKPRAVEILRESLRHENPYIRNHAIEVAADTQQKDMMAEIIRLGDDPAVAIRFAAITAAGDMLCVGCEQDVRKHLRDEDENVRLAAAYSLVKLNYPEFHESLRQAVNHEDQTVRANAVLLIGKAGNRDDLDILYKIIRDDRADEKVKLQAIDSIARLKDTRLYRSKLWALLISKYADDRVMGIRGMGALGTQDAKSAIMTLLGKDGDEVLEVRLCAAEQLGKLGDRSGHDEVAAYLASNPDMNKPEVANLLAAMAIGRIGTPELVAYLPRVLNSRSDAIRLAGAQSALLLAK